MRLLSILAYLLCALFTAAEAGEAEMAKTHSTSAEMTDIFEADQAARKGAKINWVTVHEEDLKRQIRTQALLDAGQLNSGDDFYHAAFVFQHGDLPEDCLKAHALAVIAAARGKPEATWIAAATLDRYLQRIGQPQIYGTQYRRDEEGAWTQAPYRGDLLSDALREATGVPPIRQQEVKLKEMARKAP
jgi:hypothetical protein